MRLHGRMLGLFSPETLEATLMWLAAPSSIPSVWIPAGITLWALLTAMTRAMDWVILALAVPLAHTFAWIDDNSRGMVIDVGLHIPPVHHVFLILAVLVFGYRMRLRHAFAFSWICLMVVDFTAGGQINANYPVPPAPFGIGGAGWLDALFIGPIGAVYCVWACGYLARRYHQVRAFQAGVASRLSMA